jgi:hypothetical protein
MKLFDNFSGRNNFLQTVCQRGSASAFHITVLISACLFVTHARAQSDPPTIRFDYVVANGANPILRATTNVPDGTSLLVTVKKPYLFNAPQRLLRGLAACGDDCLPATLANGMAAARVSVSNGRFEAGPYSFNGRPFKAGLYAVEVTLDVPMASLTSEQVNRLVGTVLHTSYVRVGTGSQSQRTQNPESGDATVFRSRFMLAGFLLRAAAVCGDDFKRTVTAGFDLVASPSNDKKSARKDQNLDGKGRRTFEHRIEAGRPGRRVFLRLGSAREG